MLIDAPPLYMQEKASGVFVDTSDAFLLYPLRQFYLHVKKEIATILVLYGWTVFRAALKSLFAATVF
jgi:hypothetical protein